MNTGAILKLYFDRKRVSQPAYSLRALARDLKVSPAYLSQVFNGKKPVPESRLADFIRLLDLDDIAVLQLKEAIHPEEKRTKELAQGDKDFFGRFKPLDKKKYGVLEHWYMIALLDLTTIEGFQSNPDWIARKLKITRLEVDLAIETLKANNLLKDSDGKLEKVDLKLRFPTKITQTVIRKFHKQMIKKAYEEIDTRLLDEEYNDRLVVGGTFALNPAHLPLLKEKVQEALYEISLKASEGPCESVYQLNIQLFPLTK
jgi:uncharacterized protein (TIGR02147 family)